MPRSDFLRALVFALIAGLGVVPFWALAARHLAVDDALGMYLLGSAVVYVTLIAPRARSPLGATVLCASLATAVAIIAPGLPTAALASAVIVALARSGMLRPLPIGRALWVEGSLWLGGLALGAWLYDGSLAGYALAVWVVWLLQALYALTPTSERSEDGDGAGADPFDVALGAADRLMER